MARYSCAQVHTIESSRKICLESLERSAFIHTSVYFLFFSQWSNLFDINQKKHYNSTNN
jgi:hypothetical protein